MAEATPFTAEAGPASLELKQLGRDPKSLKHKHKGKRAQPTGSVGSGGADGSSLLLKRSPSHHHAHGKRGASGGAKTSREDALRELLAGKIAEIEVGGDENLEGPIDLTGMAVISSLQHLTADQLTVSCHRCFPSRYLPGRDAAGQDDGACRRRGGGRRALG